MKRLMVVGGLAVTLAVAALQHSPPAQSSTPEIKAALVASALSFEPVPKIDLRVTDYTAPMPIVALATSRSNGPGWIRPTRRYSGNRYQFEYSAHSTQVDTRNARLGVPLARMPHAD
jgi:hypothetical protein